MDTRNGRVVEFLTNSVPRRQVNPFCEATWPRLVAVESSRGLVYLRRSVSAWVRSVRPVRWTVGNLVVLDGTTLYFVITHQYSQIAARRKFAPFE